MALKTRTQLLLSEVLPKITAKLASIGLRVLDGNDFKPKPVIGNKRRR